MNLDMIKSEIRRLCESQTQIHINVSSKKPKINVADRSASITGVYKNLFRIEVVENGTKKAYTVPYTDVFIGKVEIRELKEQLK